MKRNLPRIFISKPILRFRLNDEVQLTEVQKNLGWKYFLVCNLFFCIFFRNWFPGLLKKNPPRRHPYLWAFVNNILLPSTIWSWYTHVFKARKYTDSLFTEQHIGLVYFFLLMDAIKIFVDASHIKCQINWEIFVAFLKNSNCN